jgi:hypothetical protein
MSDRDWAPELCPECDCPIGGITVGCQTCEDPRGLRKEVTGRTLIDMIQASMHRSGRACRPGCACLGGLGYCD